MTDLCDEEEAAAEARKHINFATEVDPSNPEGWQVIWMFYVRSSCFKFFFSPGKHGLLLLSFSSFLTFSVL